MMWGVPARRASWMVALLLGGTLSTQALAQQDLSDSVDGVAVNGLGLPAARTAATAQEYTINLEDCEQLAADNDEIRFQWTFDSNLPTDAQYAVKVQLSDQTCNLSTLSTAEGDDCSTATSATNLTSETVTEDFDFRVLTGLSGASDCATPPSTVDVAVIFTAFGTIGEGDDDTDYDETRIIFRTTRPGTPTNVAAEAGESSIGVTWNEVNEDDIDSYRVYYSTSVLTAGSDPAEVDASWEDTNTTELTIDATIDSNSVYYVAVTAVDDDENEGLLSEVVTVSTQPVTDFYELYRSEGGTDRGGYCAYVRGEPRPELLLLVALVGLAVVRRRRSVCVVRGTRDND